MSPHYARRCGEPKYGNFESRQYLYPSFLLTCSARQSMPSSLFMRLSGTEEANLAVAST